MWAGEVIGNDRVGRTDKEAVVETNGGNARRTLWAYAYQIVPPKAVDGLKEIEELLDAEHKQAKDTARTWRGKLICEEQVTHILVVSDSPDQHADVNRRIERRLEQLKTGFSRTEPLPIPGGGDPDPRAPGAGTP